jgi:tetratricopeptide (TPR) repeat protein
MNFANAGNSTGNPSTLLRTWGTRPPYYMDVEKTESVPQGLKPTSAPWRYGTAEAVPFVRQSFTAACLAPERVAIAFLLMLLASFCVCRVDAAEQRFPEIETLVRQGRLAEEESKMQEELQQKPSVEGYNLLEIIESDRQDLPNAVAAFQQALQLSPKSAQTHNNLGNVYVAQKKIELAEKEFLTALRLDPANPDANYNLGVLLMARGSPAEVIPHLERVRPANLETSLNLVRAYLESKRASEGLRMAAELSQQHKNDVKVHFSLGVLLASEGQYKTGQLPPPVPQSAGPMSLYNHRKL